MANLLTAFSLGLLATISPCFLPLYPMFLAYLVNQSPVTDKRSILRQVSYSLVVLVGIMCTMLLIGAIINLLHIATGQLLVLVTPAVDLIIILLGLLMVLNLEVFARLPQAPLPMLKSPGWRAFLYGLLYGPLLMPCCAPLLISVFALSITSLSISDRLAFLISFGLGMGAPLIALSLLSQLQQRWLLSHLRRRFLLARRFAGLILVLMGVYDFIRQWPFIRLYLS